jgi:hypothetical protein
MHVEYEDRIHSRIQRIEFEAYMWNMRIEFIVEFRAEFRELNSEHAWNMRIEFGVEFRSASIYA